MAKTTSKTYKGFTINASKDKPCDTDILEQYDKRLQYMLSGHSRVLQKRLDLHYPDDGSVKPSQEHISRFTANLSRDLKRNNPLPADGSKRSAGRKEPAAHQVDPQILWVKEQHDEERPPHCHVVVWANGSAVKAGWSIQKRAERQWANALELDEAPGLVNNCNQSGPDSILIDKNKPDFEEKLNAATHQGSYLAKTRGKEHRAKGEWKSGGTRVPKGKK